MKKYGLFEIAGNYGQVDPGAENTVELREAGAPDNPPFSVAAGGVIGVSEPGDYLVSASILVQPSSLDELLTLSIKKTDNTGALSLVAAGSVQAAKVDQRCQLTGILRMITAGEVHLRGVTTSSTRVTLGSAASVVHVMKL